MTCTLVGGFFLFLILMANKTLRDAGCLLLLIFLFYLVFAVVLSLTMPTPPH